ncbi:MAG: hypothetical protein ACJAV2_004825, partial [Myxococcota bacterium]
MGATGHAAVERAVDDGLNARVAAEAGGQLKDGGALVFEALTDGQIQSNISATEPVNRLLGVADDEQLSTHSADLGWVGLVGCVSGQEQQDVGLERVSVLKLVYKKVCEALLQVVPDISIGAKDGARLRQQVEVVDRPFALKTPHVVVDHRPQLGVQSA